MHRRYGVSISNIVLPTDFSHGSEVTFAHALRIVLGTKGQLEILHVDREQKRVDWDSYPGIRETLCRWNVLPPDAQRSDVGKLGVHISKSAAKGVETAASVLEHLERRDADLVIMATHRREGIDRWLHGNLAQNISNRAQAAALFIPYDVDGFVDLATGEVSLKSILIPIDSRPNPQSAVDAVAALVEAIAPNSVEITLLHIGDPAQMPAPTLPTSEKCNWIWENRVGNVVDSIGEYASENDSDLIVMTTDGRDGFLDAIRGTTTERVLHRAACPMLSVHVSDD